MILLAALAALQAAPLAADFYQVGRSGAGQPSLLNVTSSFRSGNYASGSIVDVLDDGFLVSRIEMSCPRSEFRMLSITSHDITGGAKNTMDMDRGRDTTTWFKRDAEAIFQHLCRDNHTGQKITTGSWADLARLRVARSE